MLRDLALKEENGIAIEGDLVELGQVANIYASRSMFADFRMRKAKNTIRRHDTDLALFAEFLQSRGVEVGDLSHSPEAWEGVTWGLVAAFQAWLLGKGYAVSSVNFRVSTVKAYAKLAFKSGVLNASDYALIKAVEGYSKKEYSRIDEKRTNEGIKTRVGNKKVDAVSLTWAKAKKLKDQPDTPQGRRDALMMCLFIDHGLRVSEVAALTVDEFYSDFGKFRFYRQKVDKYSTHEMTGDTQRAAKAYQENDALENGLLLRGSFNRGNPEGWHKGALTGEMSGRAVSKRVNLLGKRIGLENLSPHDCRHYAATKYAKTKPMRWLMDWFGWTSPYTAMGYIESTKVLSTKETE